MTIYDWITKHPDDPFRVIQYVPAPDVLDANGNPACGGEGTSTVMYDTETCAGHLPDLLLNDITAINLGDDEVTELEYIPDELWI